MEPDWLDKDFVLFLHDLVIEETGGSQGVRDEALLESALSRPQNAYHYENADIHELAAIYAEGISSNHPFIDGNKRTAFAAAGMFLEANGYELGVEKDNEQEILFLQLADGKVSRAELAEWYRQNTKGLAREQERMATQESEPIKDAVQELGQTISTGLNATANVADIAADLADVSREIDQAEREQRADRGRVEPAHEIDNADSVRAFHDNRERTRHDDRAAMLEAKREQSPTLSGPAHDLGRAALHVVGSAAEKLEDIAGSLLDLLGPAEPPLTWRDSLNRKDAWERHFAEERREAERDAALDKIIDDRRTGKNLNPENLRADIAKLGRDDLETIKKYGDDGIKRLIDERERQLLQRTRNRDRDERER